MGINIKRLKFHRLKLWQLFLVLFILLALEATFLRLDHIKMSDLRTAVISADESEDDALLLESLESLKTFVFNNVVVNITEENGVTKFQLGTGPFYLEHQYLRAATKAIEEAEQNLQSDTNPNGNIYAKVAEYCKATAINNGWGLRSSNYINCIKTEAQKYPASDSIQDAIVAQIPSTELYRKEYSSPIWAPTLSGFTLLLILLILTILAIRAIMWIILRITLLFL